MMNDNIPEITVFADLREALLRHDDPKRRWPKWQFLFARDLAIQIQPQAELARYHTILFKCRALEGDGIRREHFRSSSAASNAGLARVDFEIRTPREQTNIHYGAWQLKVTGIALHRRFEGSSVEEWRAAKAAFEALENRVVDALRPDEVGQINAQMLSHYCLICGRALTDPISMARLIGPECAADYDIPTVRQIQVAAPAMPGSAQLASPDLFAAAE